MVLALCSRVPTTLYLDGSVWWLSHCKYRSVCVARIIFWLCGQAFASFQHGLFTHTDLYLQWDSHHTLPSKYSVVGTLLHRANTICSEPQLLRQEEDHLYKALSTCNYPTWALNRIKMKIKNSNTNRNNTKQKKPGTDNIQKPHITVPYQRGLSESFRRTCNNHGVQVHFKGGKTIKNLLMAPKDQDPIKNRSGVIYRFKCNRVECDDEYIGESSRTFGERFKEHLKAPFPVFDHYNSTGHQVSLENFSIVGREEQNLMRAIKEALYIRVNNPSLNRNIGKYNLPHIWDEVLFNTFRTQIEVTDPVAIPSATWQ